MSDSRFRAVIGDVVPLGPRLLLSVRGATVRPGLPCPAVLMETGERLTLLDLTSPPALWLQGEGALLVEAAPGANWREWRGRTVETL